MNPIRNLCCSGLVLSLVLSLAACSDDVSGPNRPPVAVAGADRVTVPGTPVTLDGSGSYDPDGDALSGFEWSLLAVPAGSQARLDPAQARQPQVVLTPDLPGTHVLGLVVSDGLLGSARDVVQVLAEAVPCEVPADCPDDGLWCTGTPDCVGGSCVEIAPDCSDTDACTQDLCDEDLNQCTHPPVANPPPENAATAGSCTDGVDNDCDTLTDAADPGCTACTVAGDCPDDGLWCTGTPDCVGGVCVETPPDCSDIDACTQDLCDEDLNQCTHPPVANPPPEDLATAGSCTDGVDNDCDTLIDDADPGCTACQGAGDCPDDNDVCTGVECVGGACQYPPANEGGGCDDQLFCTEGDQCVLGECQGLPRDCSGVTDACNTGVCDEQAGACVPVPVQNGTSCGAGSCQGLSWTGPTCVDGGCSGSDTEDCNDGSLCTDDSCDGATGCGHTPAHEGEECGARTCDVLVWTQVVCRAGQCDLVQAVLDCDDGNVCTDDACDAATGCGNTHNTLGCDDADDCTTGDVCQGGGCAGAPLDEDGDGYGPSNLGCGLDCDDEDEFVNPGVFEGPFGDSVCSDGLDNDCDGAIDDLDSTCLQCQDDQECDNGDFCDGAETCSAGGACVAGVAPCPDTECNHCDESLNVCFDPLGTACGSSGDTACDNPDTCDGAGTCRPNFENTGFACGDPSNTDCTDPDSCDGAGTCLLNDAAASTPCGNNNDTDCDDPDSCNGAGQCLPNYVGASTPCGNPADTGCTNPDTCNGSGTCLVNHEAPGFACGSPANTECDNPDSCDGSGNCLTNYEAPGFACGSPTDTECDNPDACNGAGTCLTNYEAPGFACGSPANTECDNPDACNGSGTCLVNHEPELTACPDALYCNGAESCDVLGACADRADPCPGTECNTCQEWGDTCFDPEGTLCGDSSDTECSKPDTCSGDGVCNPNHANEGGACQGAMTEESCDSSCQAGVCNDGLPAANLTVCSDPVGNAGICCSSVCRAGGECCAPADCDDNNGCTTDGCSVAYACTSLCSDPNCMQLDVTSPASVGADTPVTIDMCPAARDVADFVCLSDRNHSGILFQQNFETDLNGFSSTVNATRVQIAGNWVASVCRNGGLLQVNLDTRGRYDIAVSFTAAPSSLEDSEILELVYYNGSAWKSLALIGDGELGSPINTTQTIHVILPADADNNQNVRLEWYLRGGNDNADCALVDNILVYDMLPMASVATPLPTQDFEDGADPFGMFNEFDPNPQDVFTTNDVSSVRVRVDDNALASLYSDALDTSAVDPYDLLVLSWDWIGINIFNADRYIVVEYSTDNLTWTPLSATGHVDAPAGYVRYRAILPCAAYGISTLRVRFYAPITTDNGENDGVNIDNVRLDAMHPDFIDDFGAFTDQTNGIYTGSMTSDPAGAFNVICRYGCSVWSNWDPVTVNP